MSLQPGARIGPYEIVAAIGHGGMGEVYRARDAKLGRDVAVKILPDAFLSDPDRLERFAREARLLASLNHNNIAHVYGIEEAGASPAIVMELVEGPTLADRLAAGALPLDEILPIARQVAEALIAAHEAGVIHRDLKPANVKVRDDGTVKVLDFGLAKAFAADPEASSPDESPTLTARGTELGVILGTAAYMAPEQAKGRHVDKRADVWAFGVVLYEMLTGQRLFSGEDVTDTLAAVLRAEPKWSELPAETPSGLRRLLRRALQRKRQDRLADMTDARLEIADVEAGVTDDRSRPADPVAAPPAFWLRTVVLALAALALVTAAVLTTTWLNPAPGPPPVTRVTLTIGDEPVERARGLAFSSDARTLAFVNPDAGIYLRNRDQLQPVLLQGTANAEMPFFSPDGEWIGYFAGAEGLRKVPSSGGPSAPLVATGSRRGAAWGPDGEIVVAAAGFPGLMLVPESGGEARRLTEGDATNLHKWPEFLPNGRAIVFSIGAALDTSRLAAVSLDDGVVRDFGVSGSDPSYLPSGHLIFGRESSLWVVPFDSERLEITGEARPVLEHARVYAGGFANFAVAGDGSIAYSTGEDPRWLPVMVEPDGRVSALTDETQAFGEPRFSPDGERLAIERDDDIWIFDIARRSASRLTTIGGQRPEWSADGTRIIFDGPDGIYSQPWNQSAEAERLLPAVGANPFWVPSRQAETVLFTATAGNWDILVWTPGQDPEPWLATEAMEFGARASPDGRWIAYMSNVSGRNEVYVSSFDGSGGRIPISTNGGTGPVWSHDGRSLFYFAEVLWQVPFDGGAANPAGTPVALPLATTFDLRFRDGLGTAYQYDVAPDGRIVVLGRPAPGERGRVEIVYHFAEELKGQGRR